MIRDRHSVWTESVSRKKSKPAPESGKLPSLSASPISVVEGKYRQNHGSQGGAVEVKAESQGSRLNHRIKVEALEGH